jgi:hypothetical protein
MEKRANTYDLIVIGGGPSGMMAAGRAGELGARVLLIEKNKDLGRKLLLTGGGRCNITNDIQDPRKFLDHFPQAKSFLYSPFSKFSVNDTFAFFEYHGLPLVTETHGRVFPKTQRAEDVLRTLLEVMKKEGVEVRKGIKVDSLKILPDQTFCLSSKGILFHAKYVVVATGGLAAPETGSTGDGFTFMRNIGHTINTPNPNLVPLTTDETWVHALSGLTLSFMTLRFKQDGKTKIKKTGKVLFTHFGISGPLVLNASFDVVQLLKKGPVEASIDMFPDTEENELDRRVFNLFEKNKNKTLKNLLPEMMHKNMAKGLLEMKDLQIGEKKVHSITKEERKELVKRMKNLSFPITGTLGLDKSIVADGGIPPQEINFKNMSSTHYPNLYVLGDMLDINRPSGGFSLQLCWTTGWVAGNDIGEKVQKERAKTKNEKSSE